MSLTGCGQCLCAQKIYRFPIIPLPRRPRLQRVWSPSTSSHAPLLPSSLLYHLHLANSDRLKPTWTIPSKLSLPFSHKLLIVLSPLPRWVFRCLEGIYHVLILFKYLLMCLVILQAYGLLQGFCLPLYPQLLVEGWARRKYHTCFWMSKHWGEKSPEAWLFLEVDVNKLINWATGIAKSRTRMRSWALPLHLLSLFLSEHWLHSWTGSRAVAASGGMLWSQRCQFTPGWGGEGEEQGLRVSEQLPELRMRIVFSRLNKDISVNSCTL